MPQPTDKFGFSYALTPVVKKLITANVIVFAVDWVFEIGGLFAFYPAGIFIQPWGLFTYMFVHGGIGHLLGNMLGLAIFGPALENRWGGQQFLKLYVCCGLGGSALHFLSGPTSTLPMFGASGAAYGVTLAFAMIWPNAPLFLGSFWVRAKYLAGLYVILSLLSGFSGVDDGVAHFTHLGGLLAAFIYLKAATPPTIQGQVGVTSSRSVSSPGSVAAQPTKAAPQPPRPSQTATPPSRTSGSGPDRVAEPSAEAGSLDTRVVVKITAEQAARGCKVRLKTGSGEQVELPIPAGTTSGAHLRVPGGGIRKGNQVGDQWVRVTIEG